MKFDTTGLIEADGSISAFDWGGVRGYIEQSLEDPNVISWLGSSRQAQLTSMLQARTDVFQELDNQTCFVHGDYNTGNILIHETNLAGIIDWEFSHSGTPYMDIGNLLRNTNKVFHIEIEQGLREGGMELPRDWKERAELVDLTSQLEFLTSSRSDEFERTCLTKIDCTIGRYA